MAFAVGKKLYMACVAFCPHSGSKDSGVIPLFEIQWQKSAGENSGIPHKRGILSPFHFFFD